MTEVSLGQGVCKCGGRKRGPNSSSSQLIWGRLGAFGIPAGVTGISARRTCSTSQGEGVRFETGPHRGNAVPFNKYLPCTYLFLCPAFCKLPGRTEKSHHSVQDLKFCRWIRAAPRKKHRRSHHDPQGGRQEGEPPGKGCRQSSKGLGSGAGFVRGRPLTPAGPN